MVIRLPDLKIVDRAGVVGTIRFPYVPGLLSFRESPLLLQAWERLQVRPDVVMIPEARYRIPEPTRQAHLLVNAMRRGDVSLTSG